MDFFRHNESVIKFLKLRIAQSVNILKKITDLYTLRGQILKYVNYISTSLL